MKKFWKPFAELGTAFKNSFAVDIFTTARFKIAFLYLVMGLVILTVAGYLVYTHILAIVQDVILIIGQLLAQKTPVDQASATNLITQTVSAEVAKMNLALGLWVVVTILISAYILAGITLLPIRRAMEKQKRFIANVSHELRTPLSVMKMDTEVALLGGGSEVAQAELIATLKSNLEEVDRMSRITQFLLDFSNSENRRTRLSFSRVDLSVVVQNAVKLMQKAAEEKNVALNFMNGSRVTINGNAVALEEMVLNLVKNAVNYTLPGGSVTVRISRTGYQPYGWAMLSIQDTGVGIPAEDLPRLFEPFYRGKNARTATGEHSAGIGLAIVQEIANLHKATVSVRSVVGQGTNISLRFSLLRS